MKQLSLFLVFIISLNSIDLISSNRYREYEAPRIVHVSSPQEKEAEQNKLDLDTLNREDTLFSAEKILKWIEEVDKKDFAKMKKEEIHHSLEGIKRASSQIQSYLKRISAQIEASINTIDLKVNEISIIDQKISQLKPAYKKELEKVSKESGSLLTALNKEKTAVEQVLKKLRKESTDISEISNRSDDVDKKIELLDLSKNVKDRINEKLISFMSLKNFEKAHKKFMTVVESELEKNFEAYKKYTDDKIAADLIVKNWSETLKKVENEEEVVVESINKTVKEKKNSFQLDKSEQEEKKNNEEKEEMKNITTEDEPNEEENEVNSHKEILKNSKSNRKSTQANKKSSAVEKKEKPVESEDNEDEENEDQENDENDEEEQNSKDSESEFDQEYFNKEQNTSNPSFLEKKSNNNDNEEDEN